jgi:hypothetical protein
MISIYLQLVKTISLFVAYGLSFSSPEIINCKSEVDMKISEVLQLKSENIRWIKAEPMMSDQVWRIKGSKFGWWVEVVVKDKLVKKIIAMNPDQVLEISLDHKCKSAKKKIEKITPAYRSNFANHLKINDTKLQKIITETQNGLIYIWSPKMRYSVEQYDLFEKYAKKNKLHFMALLDPIYNFEDIFDLNHKSIKPSSVYQLDSIELFYRDATIHYPTTFIYLSGSLIDKTLVGAYSEKQLQKEILWANKK